MAGRGLRCRAGKADLKYGTVVVVVGEVCGW